MLNDNVSNVCQALPDGVVSELHLVDLIGSQSMAGGGMGVTPGGVGVGGAGAAWERERRAAAVQLLAFTRVVGRFRLTVSKPVLKTPMVSALGTIIR